MTEVRISSRRERPCAGIEDTPETSIGTGGRGINPSSTPQCVRTGKRLAGKLHEPFERAGGGRAKAPPLPTLQVMSSARLVRHSETERWSKQDRPSRKRGLKA